LAGAGFNVVHAENGRVALQRLAEGSVDLVLSDIVMPVMDDYELCRQIKDNQPDRPVVLLTSLTDPLDVLRGSSAGADSFFRKPHNLDNLDNLDNLAIRLRGILCTREMRLQARSRMGLELFFLASASPLTAERQHLLDLLISTFEDLVTTNEQLRERESTWPRHTPHWPVGWSRPSANARGWAPSWPQGAVNEVYEALFDMLGRQRDEFVTDPGAALSLLVDDRVRRGPLAASRSRRPWPRPPTQRAAAASTSSSSTATREGRRHGLCRPGSRRSTERSRARSGCCTASRGWSRTTR
jgi:CheY-like chemotaxis protein